MLENNKILVTGAGGFIGGRIVELLYLTKLYPFIASVRSWTSCTRIGRFPIDIVKMDILDEKEVKNFFDGINIVIHSAYGSGGVTEKGTKNILEACLENGVKRVIHLSTIEVYTNAKGSVAEDYECTHTGNDYGDSKLEAEKICFEYMKKGLQICILRLPIVYGPFSRNWTINIAKLLIHKKIGVFDELGEGRCNLLYVDDLFQAIIKVLKTDKAFGNVYNINGKEVISWNEYFRRFNNKLGLDELKKIESSDAKLRKNLLLPIRIIGGYLKNNYMNILKALSLKSEIANRIMRYMEKELKMSLSEADFKLFSQDAVFNIDKAKKDFQYDPIFSVDYGLDATTLWLRLNGLVNNTNI